MQQDNQSFLEADTDKRPVVSKTSSQAVPVAKKMRADRGRIIPTRRDLACLTWIADQYAVRGDHIRHLLSRYPDPQKPFHGQDGLIAATTTRDLLARWQRAGWIEYQLVLNDQPGWAWVTKKGLVLVGLDERYTYRVPASTRLDHLYGVNEVRLEGERSGHSWQSERWYRSLQPKNKKGEISGPIPDGIITTQKGSVDVVEVELTAKKPEELIRKMRHLAYYKKMDPVTTKDVVFRHIYFFVPTERMKVVVERAAKELREEDQRRVVIIVRPSLVALRHRPGAAGPAGPGSSAR